MKHFLQTTLFLILSVAAFSQPCTQPDTALMRKNKVNVVNVYYHPNDTSKFLNHVYEFNRRGQLVREREGYSTLWAGYKYDESGRVIETSNSTDAAGVTTRTTITFFGDNPHAREIRYSHNDGNGLQLKMVYRYDSLNRMTYQAWYYADTLRRAQFLYPKNDKGPVDARDSMITERMVTWMVNGRLVMWTKYDRNWKNPVTSEFTYNDNDGSMIREVRTDSSGKHIYIPEFSPDGRVLDVKRDGKSLKKAEVFQWDIAHNSFPRPREKSYDDYERYQDYGLPVPDLVQQRKPVYNKRGLITEEVLNLSTGYPNVVKFSYEYTFFK